MSRGEWVALAIGAAVLFLAWRMVEAQYAQASAHLAAVQRSNGIAQAGGSVVSYLLA
jgi:hypothetical protein